MLAYHTVLPDTRHSISLNLCKEGVRFEVELVDTSVLQGRRWTGAVHNIFKRVRYQACVGQGPE